MGMPLRSNKGIELIFSEGMFSGLFFAIIRLKSCVFIGVSSSLAESLRTCTELIAYRSSSALMRLTTLACILFSSSPSELRCKLVPSFLMSIFVRFSKVLPKPPAELKPSSICPPLLEYKLFGSSVYSYCV